MCIRDRDYEKQLKKGDNLIFTAFGAGFTYGAVYVKWGYAVSYTHLDVYKRQVQRAATTRVDANPQNLSQFGLESATRLHEAGFASNRASATAR